MEPWDGPASVAFTDGTVIGAVLDRNGLRPSRYWVTDDDLVVMATEVGVIDIDPAKVVTKGRLQPGRMFLIDTARGRIVDDEEIKATLAAEHPYARVAGAEPGRARRAAATRARRVQPRERAAPPAGVRLHPRGAEDHPRPDAAKGAEPIGSMGTDTPIAVLSERPRLLFDYFQQLFAQVTNPPLDAIREEVVTSVSSTVGPEADLLRPGPESCRQLTLPFPIIDNDELAKIVHANDDGRFPGLRAHVVRGLYRVAGGGLALERALRRSVTRCRTAIDDGARIIVLSDRNGDATEAPIPSLLLTAAVHHHLVRDKQRTKVGLIVECGDAREVHHMALLIGYGAGAINPYLAFESIEDLIAESLHGLGGIDPHKAVRNYIKAAGKGVLKVMWKMGVTTVASYTGAQIFEAIGLGQELVERVLHRHRQPPRRHRARRDRRRGRGPPRRRPPDPSRGAGPPQARARRRVPVAPRGRGPPVQPGDGVQAAARHAGQALRHLQAVHAAGRRPVRSAWPRCAGCSSSRTARGEPIPIDEVEPVSSIVHRFSTGAMSYGSISVEAHETLAIAMNSIGGKCNTGEGGEDPERLHDPHGARAIKQVASGPLRRHQRVPRQRRRPADQDGPGRQAGRGRPAARPQGVPVDRQDPALHARASG